MNKLFALLVIYNIVHVYGKSVNKVTVGAELKKGKLKWSDEFNSIENFDKNWMFEIGGSGWANNELQYYTENKNTYLRDSLLTIEARKENFNDRQYTSARIKTYKSFRYGVFEMRAKLPRGRGTWPAFWLLSNKKPITWPDDGEIDVLEHVGYDMGKVHANVHTKNFNHMIGTGKGDSIMVDNIDTEFHLYQLEWKPDSISIFVDNNEFFTYRKTDTSYDTWPFDDEFEILLNLSVGGNWAGLRGIDSLAFPAQYVIDYVRVYDLV